jgi:hypothetical protein
VWAILPLTDKMPDTAVKGDPALAWTLINGTVNGTLLAGDVATYAGTAKEILTGTRLEISATTDVSLKFSQTPLDIWVDGQPLKENKIRLEPGIHKIVIRHKTGANFRFEASAGTFLPTW